MVVKLNIGSSSRTHQERQRVAAGLCQQKIVPFFFFYHLGQIAYS